MSLTERPTMRSLPYLITFAAITLVWAIDLPTTLGAHPWWSQQAALIGGAIGLALGFAASFLGDRQRAMAVAFPLLMLVGFTVAKHGQITFAASYGDDTFAGKLWYFGWFGTGIFFNATILSWSKRLLNR
jgi:hypothetical protein